MAPMRCCVPSSSIRRGVVPGQTLAEARRLGATRAFLLTNTARDYFAGLGFAAIDRTAAPAAILATRQAAGLCPSSAPLMVKSIN
jgi:arsenate reductase